MGSDVELLVLGDAALLDVAQRRIAELERRWSRFVDDSEISALNRRAGSPVEVSDDTIELVTLAQEAWRVTGALFEPLVLGAVLRAGYTSSFETMADEVPAGRSALALVACTDIVIEGNTVTLPGGTGFDPGGIGKGLTADLVLADLLAAGAAGACVNMGGDVRAGGVAPDGEVGWTIGVEHPWSAEPVARLGIGDGAVATSTTLRRRWRVAGVERHHLIDPRTGEPAVTPINLVTVIAATAWGAEVLAKAVLLRGAHHPLDIVEGTGAEALYVTEEGDVVTTPGFTAFTGGVVPVRVARPGRSRP